VAPRASEEIGDITEDWPPDLEEIAIALETGRWPISRSTARSAQPRRAGGRRVATPLLGGPRPGRVARLAALQPGRRRLRQWRWQAAKRVRGRAV